MKIKTNKNGKELAIGFTLIVFAIIAPLIIRNTYFQHLLVIGAINVGLAVSMNLILGYAGLFSLAHAAFFGIGAYTSAIIAGKLGLPIWIGFCLSGVIASLFGMLIAIPSLNLRGDYLAIVTLGFGQIIRLVELNENWLTNGAMGILAIPKPMLFGEKFSKVEFYYLALIIALLIIFIVNRIVNSRIGRALISIREDDLAAQAVGVDTTKYKILAFGIGTFCAGLMGSVYAHYISFVSPDQYSFQISVNIFAMAIIGGLGTMLGPIFGAILMTLLPEVMRSFEVYRMIIVGLIMVVTMVFRPQGIYGSYLIGATSIWNALAKKRDRSLRKRVQNEAH